VRVESSEDKLSYEFVDSAVARIERQVQKKVGHEEKGSHAEFTIPVRSARVCPGHLDTGRVPGYSHYHRVLL